MEYFFIDLKGLTPIVYFHDGLLLEIHAYDDDYIKDFQVKERLNLCVIVEKIGRAGSPQNRAKKQEEWDKKYGKNKWCVFYEI